jgi:hypothetical protein
MRRILLSLAGIALLALPAATAAGAAGAGKPGFLVVHKAQGDGGVNGPAVVTVVVQGFVLGSASQEAQVDIYHLPSVAGGGGPQASGADVRQTPVRWRKFIGTRYSGSSFRFRAIGGAYRVVVHGSGIYLFAGGQGFVTLHGSSLFPLTDGHYSLGGRAFKSLPPSSVKLKIGRG